MSNADHEAAAQALSGFVDISETPLAKRKEAELEASVRELLAQREEFRKRDQAKEAE